MGTITAQQGAGLSEKVYNDLSSYVGTKKTVSDGFGNLYTVSAFYSDPNIGLQIAVYQNGKDNVIAVRGTEPFSLDGDITTNVNMFVSTLADMLPSAFIQALQFIESLNGLNSSNTSIVGHSMGGSIAQYLGSATGFQTLTYNAYGIGNMGMVPASSGANITNYITMHDFVSPLPGSKMTGQTYMLQDETLTDVLGHGITNFTTEDSWIRGYSPVDNPRSIDVIDGIGSSGLDSAYELALRLSEGREFAMINGSMDDVIYGGDIDNILIGGGGNDTLDGMGGTDILSGGEGFDTYIANNGDTIEDSDGQGLVYFNNIDLTGTKTLKKDTIDTHQDANGQSVMRDVLFSYEYTREIA